MNQPYKAGVAENGEPPRSRASRVAFFGGSFDPPHLGHLAVARAARAAFALDAVWFAPVAMQPLKPEGPVASFEDRLAMTQLAIAGQPGFEVSLADAPKLPDAPESSDAHRRADTCQSTPNSTPNYTIDTLKSLRNSLAPGSLLFCLMGADSFLGLRYWHRAAEIPFVAPLIVASRPGQPLDDLKAALPTGLALETTPEEDRREAGVEVRAFVVVNQAGSRAPLYVLPGLHVDISASEIRSEIRAKTHAASVIAAAGRDLVPATVRDYIAQHNLYRS